MAPVLQIGRMSIPADQEDEFNEFYTRHTPRTTSRWRAAGGSEGTPCTMVLALNILWSTSWSTERVSQSEEWLAARQKSGGALGDTFPRMQHDEGSPGHL